MSDQPAYPKDTGPYTLNVDVGYDYTGYSTITARVTDPSGNVETGATVVAAADPTDEYVVLTVSKTAPVLTDEVGEWIVVIDIDGKRSEPAGSYRVVTEAENVIRG